TRLASAGGDGTVRIWDVVTSTERQRLRGHTGALKSVAFSPDGRRLASSGGSDDGSIRIWDVATGQELLRPRAYTRGQYSEADPGVATPHVGRVTFSPDSNRLASAVGAEAKVWDATTGQELLSLRGHSSSVVGVVFSPDGTRLATTS